MSDGQGDDYYAVLGVDRDATSLQIKQAYRKLALKWRAHLTSHRRLAAAPPPHAPLQRALTNSTQMGPNPPRPDCTFTQQREQLFLFTLKQPQRCIDRAAAAQVARRCCCGF